MLDDLLWKILPPGGDLITSLTHALLWIGALLTLGSALICGLIRLLARLQPRPAPVRARRAIEPVPAHRARRAA